MSLDLTLILTTPRQGVPSHALSASVSLRYVEERQLALTLGNATGHLRVLRGVSPFFTTEATEGRGGDWRDELRPAIFVRRGLQAASPRHDNCRLLARRFSERRTTTRARNVPKTSGSSGPILSEGM